MRLLRRVLAGCHRLLHRPRAERELDEELRAFLEMAIEARVQAGQTRAEAERMARAQMGSLEAVKERTRDVGWDTHLESVWRDVWHAGRSLRRSPAFAAAAVATLALGIGANAAIFSAINAILLRPLPVERPNELVTLAALHPNGPEPVFSYAAYRRFATDAARLVDAVASSTVRRQAIALDGPPEPVDLCWVSGNYFTTLGVAPALGRTLVAADDRRPSGERAAVLSDAYWTRRFARAPDVIGRSFRLGTASFTIVGVARRGFTGDSPGEAVDLWMPLTAQPHAPAWLWEGHSTTWLRILARRRAGVDVATAAAGLASVYERIRDEVAAGTDSQEFRASTLQSRLRVADGSRGASRLRDNLATPLLLLMAIAGLVLLVACANVAHLVLARAVARRREMAIRLALGASRWRLARLSLLESLWVSTLGGLGGVLLAAWSASALQTLIAGAFPIALDVSPDGRVFGIAVLATGATTLVFGLLPLPGASRAHSGTVTRTGGSGSSGLVSRSRAGRAIVVAQIAVSLVLLVTAGLFVRNLINLKDIDTGFDPDRVLLVRLSPAPDPATLPAAAARRLYEDLVERARGIPGVEHVSGSFTGVFSRESWRNVIAVEGFAPPAGVVPRSFANGVTPAYFDTMRLALLRGRPFTPADTDTAPKVAIVNETFARQFLAGRDPVGRQVSLCSSEPCGVSRTTMAIVGLVEDGKYADLREPQRPMLYVAAVQFPRNLQELQVRTIGDPAGAAATLHRALSAVDARVAVVAMVEAREMVDRSIVAERLVATLSTTFGLLALALALVGLYGLVAYVAAQRTPEIGIRMALGAGRGEVRRLVLRDTVRLLALGLALGLPLAFGGARLLSTQLYGVPPGDPLTLGLCVVTLSAAALLAGYLPARRAARVDPCAVLRAE